MKRTTSFALRTATTFALAIVAACASSRPADRTPGDTASTEMAPTATEPEDRDGSDESAPNANKVPPANPAPDTTKSEELERKVDSLKDEIKRTYARLE